MKADNYSLYGWNTKGQPFVSLNKPTTCSEILHSPSFPLLMLSSSISITPMASKKGGTGRKKDKGCKRRRLSTLPSEDFDDSELSDEWSPPSSPSSPSSICTNDFMGLSVGERAYLRGIEQASFDDSEESEKEEESEEDEDNDGYDNGDEGGDSGSRGGINSSDDDGFGKAHDSDGGKGNGGGSDKGRDDDGGDEWGKDGKGSNDSSKGGNAGGKVPSA